MPSSSMGGATPGAELPRLIPDERLAPLPHDERVRTARHLALFDEVVQQRFAAARVCVIGAGGLGSPLLYALAAAGVGTNGHITVCDDDVVDLTNLQRQTLFGVDEVGRPKTHVARERMHALNPSMTIRTEGRFSPDNAEQLCREHDLLIDGSDNFATRFVAADAAEMTETPLVWGRARSGCAVIRRVSRRVSRRRRFATRPHPPTRTRRVKGDARRQPEIPRQKGSPTHLKTSHCLIFPIFLPTTPTCCWTSARTMNV